MRTVELNDLKPGMVIGYPVYSKTGQLIAEADTPITRKLISRFTFYKIQAVSIRNEEKRPSIEDDDIAFTVISEEEKRAEEEAATKTKNETKFQERAEKITGGSYNSELLTYSQSLSQTDDFKKFQISYALCLEDLKKNFVRIKNCEFDIANEPLLEHSEGISQYRTPLELFNLIKMVRSESDSIYAHCLNVALIAVTLGKWLKLPEKKAYDLTTAALVHDVGKIEVNSDILNKKGKLSEEERKEIENHTLYGNRLLKDAGYSSEIRMAALQHHERYDGSGYPRHLTGDEIEDFPSIIALCDVYDGMTSPRPYRAPLSTFQVIEEFEKSGYSKYNTKVLITFLEHMAGMYYNTMVLLNDGTKAKIVYINNAKLSRPILELSDGTILDLSSEKDKHIVKTI
jgi:putative nucleotidyltransferase with HDIG domain